VRGFQSVVLDLGARLGLPGFVTADGKPKFPGGYADYIVNHERAPGIGPLAGYRGADGKSYGKGAPNPKQLEQYIANGAFYQHHLPDAQRFYKHANKAYLEWARDVGFIGAPDPIIFQLYLEPLQKFRLAAMGHGAIQPPDSHRERIATHFDPLPYFYAPASATTDGAEYPLYAITQRPMHMYHSWGSQNTWLRQITAENRLYMHTSLAVKHSILDDDWVWLTSPIGRVRAQARVMDGCNPHTVWTWNAIGKREGAWALDPDAPEAQKGFLLNHLISELLPEREGGYRFSNSDPITGQAAWYDLRVRIQKAGPGEPIESAPRFERLDLSKFNGGKR
jgi:sulfite dehydrogenase (quinone) subunit SoeA